MSLRRALELKPRCVPENRVLEFPEKPGFVGWKRFFIYESFSHPALMDLNLLQWILETYTKSGDIVLDPLAGMGSTIILASLMGRHGIAVEGSPYYCNKIRKNIELAESQTTTMPKGSILCIQGDALNLSKLLNESDAIITSSPSCMHAEYETYLEALLKFYRECHKVLKPTGIMVIIVSNFIREKHIVRLDLETIKLCAAAGFALKDHWYFKPPQKPFLRLLHSKKHPEAPKVEYEDILIFEKYTYAHANTQIGTFLAPVRERRNMKKEVEYI